MKRGTADIRIEYPSRGATYARAEYGVYEYGTFPRHSVLAGQERRSFLDSFKTLEEAKAAYPSAVVIEGSCFTPPFLGHLSDDDETFDREMFTETRRGYDARDRWARRYDERNGGPEGDDDR